VQFKIFLVQNFDFSPSDSLPRNFTPVILTDNGGDDGGGGDDDDDDNNNNNNIFSFTEIKFVI